MVQSGSPKEIRGFESLTSELKSKNWDILIDKKNRAFITPFENESEKWELEVHFKNNTDYLVSSRSRWYLQEKYATLLGRTLNRMNSDFSIGVFGSELGINEDLHCFEVKTSSEFSDGKKLDSFYDTLSQNTDTYERWSDTIRSAAKHMHKLEELKDLEEKLAESNWQDEELESRLKLLSEAFLKEFDEESALRAD